MSSFRGRRQLAHPQCLLLPDGVDDDPEAVTAFAGALIPVYPATANVTSWQIAGAMRIVLDTMDEPEDPLPAEVLAAEGLIWLINGIRVRSPPTPAALTAAILMKSRRRTPSPVSSSGVAVPASVDMV